jgi:hypothetical protein
MQTNGAQNPILMFGNTLPAEKPATFGTSGNSFPLLMIPTPLLMQFLHY